MRVTVGLERLSVCPHQYELANAYLPVSEQAAGALYLGSCFHRAMELYFKARLAGETPDLNDLRQFFLDAWTEDWPFQPDMRLTRAAVDWTDSRKDPDAREYDVQADGLGMLEVYLPVAEKLTPRYVEYGDSIEVDGEPIEFHFDLLAASALIDYKTGRRAKAQIEADTSIQLSVYAWAARKLGFWTPDDEVTEFHSVTRYKKFWKRGSKLVENPEPYRVTVVQSRRNMINYEWMDEVFIPRLVAMKRANAFPAMPGRHCFWCPVRQQCGHFDSIMVGRDLDEWEVRKLMQDAGVI